MYKHKLVAFAMTAAVLVFFAPAIQASPVSFSITGATFAGGAGYGIDVGSNPENGGTLLDVAFNTTAVVPQTFSLTNIGDSYSFKLGSVVFNEPELGSGSNLGIRNQEQDNLGVTATFTFTNPLGTTTTVSAIGAAVLGSVIDPAVDYTLTWTPLTVNFGTGGQFELSLGNLSFSNIATQDEMVTVKLLAQPATAPGQTVPEPASLALLGLGLVGLAFSRRKQPVSPQVCRSRLI